jgi:hypothetical protein
MYKNNIYRVIARLLQRRRYGSMVTLYLLFTE